MQVPFPSVERQDLKLVQIVWGGDDVDLVDVPEAGLKTRNYERA